MNKPLLITLFITALGISIFLLPDGVVAVLFITVLSLIAVLIIKKTEDEQAFHLNLFFIALLLRVLLATAIYAFDLQDFFGPDAKAYDERGFILMQYLTGQIPDITEEVQYYTEGTGFYYIVASIYAITGRNPLCIQFLNAITGAGTVTADKINS